MGFCRVACVLVLLASTYPSSRTQGGKSQSLPPGVITALATDEAEHCRQFWYEDCHQTFRSNLLWRDFALTPSGQNAVLVENHNTEFCGSGGCSVYLFVRRRDGKFIQVLGKQGETSSLGSVKVLNTLTKGHYDLSKTWRDHKIHTIYRWDGARYADSCQYADSLERADCSEMNRNSTPD